MQAMTAIKLSRHTGMDSLQASLPEALRVNANLFWTDLCRTNSLGANLDVRSTGRCPNRKEAVSNPVHRDVDLFTVLGFWVPAIHAGTTWLLLD
ncbi:hypothetical protein METHB2_320004 [Candidatus Methylobacter favarea]|uniref:Uncharacterized protein n=1 Tax=Candidatus Methylobacter favarea TaxID=2707345 RepID=A0A8S0XGG8_9GAMM|nr:hypothetical protein METHB2_320004 [Candidatus Methylobacter favarea]